MCKIQKLISILPVSSAFNFLAHFAKIWLDSHMKVTGVIVGNCERHPKRYQNLVLWVWHEFIFTPERYQNKVAQRGGRINGAGR